MSIAYKFKSSSLEMLHKKYLFRKFCNVFAKTHVGGSCFNKIAGIVINCTKIGINCTKLQGCATAKIQQVENNRKLQEIETSEKQS